MKKAIDYKFQQHPDIRETLISTKDGILIEDSPNDMFWGGSLPGS